MCKQNKKNIVSVRVMLIHWCDLMSKNIKFYNRKIKKNKTSRILLAAKRSIQRVWGYVKWTVFNLYLACNLY